MKAGLFDRAEAAYKALEGTAFDAEARLALLSLHERSRDWRGRHRSGQRAGAPGGGSFATRIAHYACELALQADAPASLRRPSRRCSARAAAPQAARPHAADRAAPRTAGDHAEALQQWDEMLAQHPAAFAAGGGRLRAQRSWPPPTARRARAAAGRLRPSPTATCCRPCSSWKARPGSRRRLVLPPAAASPRWRRPRCWSCRGAMGRRTRPARQAVAAPRGRCSATAAPPAASRRTTTSGNARAARAGTPIRRGAWRRSLWPPTAALHPRGWRRRGA
jgi:hypothetical protein